jgi:hypothetical protein
LSVTVQGKLPIEILHQLSCTLIVPVSIVITVCGNINPSIKQIFVVIFNFNFPPAKATVVLFLSIKNVTGLIFPL